MPRKTNAQNSNHIVKGGKEICSFHVKKASCMPVFAPVAQYTLVKLVDASTYDCENTSCDKATTTSGKLACKIAVALPILAGQEFSVGIGIAAQEQLRKRERLQKQDMSVISETPL